MGAPANLWLEELIESEVEAMLEKDSYYESLATALRPAAMLKQEHRKQLRDFFEMKELRRQFISAQRLALELLPNVVLPGEFENIKDEIEQSASHFTRFIESIGNKGREGPILFQEMFGFSDETLLHIYDLACNLVDKKEYKNGADLFRFLTVLAPYVTGYWIGLAVCLQALDRHEEAVAVFTAAKLLSPSNPRLFAYSIESYKILKDHDKIKSECMALEEIVSGLEVHEKKKWKQKIENYRMLFFK